MSKNTVHIPVIEVLKQPADFCLLVLTIVDLYIKHVGRANEQENYKNKSSGSHDVTRASSSTRRLKREAAL